jgi:pimeloyl-ACP methyl ester carboxylesterase
LLGLSSCATPTAHFDAEARSLGFSREIVRGENFSHAVYSRVPQPPGELLHVYLEGDASPKRSIRYRPPDPTPWTSVMLGLTALDPAPSILLGRPCQHGLDLCDPLHWTLGRYGEEVVASLAVAIEAQRLARGAQGLVLIGFSGGGTLAMLLAERIPETRAVVTLAGNLDLSRWAQHHGYQPLSLSLDPAGRSPLDPEIVQIHLLAGRDRRVPPELMASELSRQPGARLRSFPEIDHACCWAAIWPETLRDLDASLEARATP